MPPSAYIVVTFLALAFSSNVIIPFETWKARGAREIDRLLWSGIVRQVKNIRPSITDDNLRTDPIPCGILFRSQFLSIENIAQKHNQGSYS